MDHPDHDVPNDSFVLGSLAKTVIHVTWPPGLSAQVSPPPGASRRNVARIVTPRAVVVTLILLRAATLVLLTI